MGEIIRDMMRLYVSTGFHPENRGYINNRAFLFRSGTVLPASLAEHKSEKPVFAFALSSLFIPKSVHNNVNINGWAGSD